MEKTFSLKFNESRNQTFRFSDRMANKLSRKPQSNDSENRSFHSQTYQTFLQRSVSSTVTLLRLRQVFELKAVHLAT